MKNKAVDGLLKKHEKLNHLEGGKSCFAHPTR